MIENIVTCDRCGKKCEGTTYYTINIYGIDINPTPGYGTTAETAFTNYNTVLSRERHYCRDCKEKIEKFLLEEDK